MGYMLSPPPRLPMSGVKHKEWFVAARSEMSREAAIKVGSVHCEYCDRYWKPDEHLNCPSCGAPLTTLFTRNTIGN